MRDGLAHVLLFVQEVGKSDCAFASAAFLATVSSSRASFASSSTARWPTSSIRLRTKSFVIGFSSRLTITPLGERHTSMGVSMTWKRAAVARFRETREIEQDGYDVVRIASEVQRVEERPRIVIGAALSRFRDDYEHRSLEFGRSGDLGVEIRSGGDWSPTRAPELRIWSGNQQEEPRSQGRPHRLAGAIVHSSRNAPLIRRHSLVSHAQWTARKCVRGVSEQVRS